MFKTFVTMHAIAAVENKLCSDQASMSTSQILVKIWVLADKLAGLVFYECIAPGNLDVSMTSIYAALKKLATTQQVGFNIPKPDLLPSNGTPTDYSNFIKNKT